MTVDVLANSISKPVAWRATQANGQMGKPSRPRCARCACVPAKASLVSGGPVVIIPCLIRVTLQVIDGGAPI